jgi:hypothetical protein
MPGIYQPGIAAGRTVQNHPRKLTEKEIPMQAK